MDSKIKYIRNCAESGVSELKKYFSDSLLDEILVWKEDRNRLIHALLKQQLEHEEVSKLAVRGDALVKLLRNRCGSCNRAIERKKKVEL